jgi:hypothetical protein
MAASKYDFAIEQGTSFKMSLVYKDANNNPINLTNWCARLTAKTNTGVSLVYDTENTDYNHYKFTIDAINGKLTLMFPARTTNGFTFTVAKYDLELQSPDDLYDGGGKYTVRLLFGAITMAKRFSQGTTLLDCDI